jgi:hypothetical protein
MYKRFFLLPLILLLSASCATSQTDKNRFSVSGDTLLRRDREYTIYAVEKPDLLQKPFSIDGLIPEINKVAKYGGNSLVFDLQGLNEDATAIDAQAAADFRDAIGQIRWRYMGGILRVIPADAPDDKAWQVQAARTAGKTFRGFHSAMYLFDWPDSADLVRAFKSEAPKVVVIAPEGGDVTLVDGSVPEGARLPVAVKTADPGSIDDETTHYILPQGDESLMIYERLRAYAAEKKPWTPDNSVLSEEERDEGFIALFNGKNFDGWTITGNEDAWQVRDGMIEWVKRGGGVIYSRDRYQDYVFRFEFNISEGGNSGVFLHAPRTCRQSKIGHEFQIMGDHGKTPTIHTTGAIYDVYAPTVNAGKPAGEWNSVEITFQGPEYKAVLNGETVVEINFAEHPELKHRILDGFFGLQDHNDYVAFRNIRVKPL